jgi:hypothetical protein
MGRERYTIRLLAPNIRMEFSVGTGSPSSGDHMSTDDMVKKVATVCKTHPNMMVEDVMKNAMAH